MNRKKTTLLLTNSLRQCPESFTDEQLGEVSGVMKLAFVAGYDQAFKRLEAMVEQARIMGRTNMRVIEIIDCITESRHTDFIEEYEL